MGYFKTILISLLTSAFMVIVALNVPASMFNVQSWISQDNLGAVGLTDILSTDKLTAYPTVQNANNLLIEEGKIDSSTTSIPTLISIGTITTGVWNATAIGVAYNGTGTTSPSTYLTMIGDGAQGFTTASTTGTSGQFWTSGGAGVYPSWTTSSLSLSDNYAWTGAHTFTIATTTMSATTTVNNMYFYGTSTPDVGHYGGISPVGSITAYATNTPPIGWLLADGQSIKTAEYPDLFRVIGYSYGGSGVDFSVPDVQNRQIMMASTTVNMGQTGGEANHTMTIPELVAHTHPYDGNNASGAEGWGDIASLSSDTKTTGSTGSTVPFNVIDPYIILNYIIKY